MGSLVRRGQVLLGRVAAPALPSWREVEIGDTYLPLPARWDVVPGHAVRLTSCVQGGGVLPGLCSSPRVDIWTPFLCFPWTDGRQCLLTTGSLSLASTCLPSRHLALQIQPVASGQEGATVPAFWSATSRRPSVVPHGCSVPLSSPRASSQHRASRPRVNHGRSRREPRATRCVSQIDRSETAGSIPTRQKRR